MPWYSYTDTVSPSVQCTESNQTLICTLSFFQCKMCSIRLFLTFTDLHVLKIATYNVCFFCLLFRRFFLCRFSTFVNYRCWKPNHIYSICHRCYQQLQLHWHVSITICPFGHTNWNGLPVTKCTNWPKSFYT